MSNSTSGLLTDGVTITQVLANAGAAADERYGASLDLDGDGVYSNSDEFVQISNFSDQPVDISGWQIWSSNDGGGADGGVYHTFAPGTFLQPGESLYVITEYTGTPPVGVVEANGIGAATNTTNTLFDGLDGEIALVNTSDPAHVEYVQFTMDSSPDNVTTYTGFPTNSDGSAATRVMGDPLPADASTDILQGYIMGAQRTYGMNNTAQNGLSVTYDPTTGEVGYINGAADFPGTTTTQAGIDLNGLTFYEVLTDNNGGATGFDVDNDGAATDADQFVSFVNTTGAPLDISGYEVWSTTQAGGDTTVYRYHTFAPGTVLQPGEVIYVVTEYTGDPSLREANIVEANGAVTTDTSDLLRANADGEIALVDPSTGDYIQFTFDRTPANLSIQAAFPGTTNLGTISASGEYVDGSQPTNSDTYRYSYDTGLVTELAQTVTLAVCFAAGTRIMTRSGEVCVENLCAAHEILTLDHGFQKLRWIGAQHLSAEILKANPNLRPIRIRSGALGRGLPERDLVVSPQHRVLARSKLAQRMFGAPEVLVAAKHLLVLDGVEIAEDLTEVTYWHFLFDRHQVVFSNGTASESLFTGPQALKAVGSCARKELLSLFPDLLANSASEPRPARRLLPGWAGRAIALRMTRNHKPLCCWQNAIST